MPALRCSMCSIDYPHTHTHMRCDVCGERTSFFSNVDTDPDWEYAVQLARGSTPPDDQVTPPVSPAEPAKRLLDRARAKSDDPGDYAGVRDKHSPTLNTVEYWWRVEELTKAGCDWEVALILAARDDVDLHQAVDIVSKAGEEMALRILT